MSMLAKIHYNIDYEQVELRIAGQRETIEFAASVCL